MLYSPDCICQYRYVVSVCQTQCDVRQRELKGHIDAAVSRRFLCRCCCMLATLEWQSARCDGGFLKPATKLDHLFVGPQKCKPFQGVHVDMLPWLAVQSIACMREAFAGLTPVRHKMVCHKGCPMLCSCNKAGSTG
jgi:hypothetical protein